MNDTRTARVIAFANQKGGVGKTTSAVNIAASLGTLGKKVLLLDMDPQGNTTSGVGVAKKTIKNSTGDALLGNCALEQAVLETKFKNLSVVPANIALAGAEFDLFGLSGSGDGAGENRMKVALAPVLPSFDYVVIDCPPSLGMLTINALTAASCVVIPLQCEFYALEGLSQLMITIGRIRQLYNKDLFVAGILITMFNGRLLLSSQVLRELKKHYAEKLFRTPISRNVKLSEAPSFGQPALYHDKYSKGAVEYIEVAKELMERV